jgi:hypothetical protein
MILKKLTLAYLGLAVIGWLGCSGTSQTDDTAAVRQGVERYLTSRTDLNLSQMRVVVENVNFEGDRADAAVTIVARNDPQAKMEMSYRLRKTADGWEVEPPQGSEAGAHGGAAAPKAAPPESGAEMPPGHPPVSGEGGSSAPDLPPGHPPVKN